MTQQLNILQSASVAVERIAQTLRERPDIRELPGASAPPLQGRLRFEGVSLAYRPGHPVLHEVDLVIAPGKKVGFVGASGAGKSSLMNLAARFYDATAGIVSIDGRDVREWPLAKLRKTVGIVQQDVTLFSGTVTDNIRFFRPEIPEERVMEACRLVGAEQFILRLPQGYETPLSERGSSLSAGERQLLSFARVLVFDPQILILDEATASLDSETEAVLQNALQCVSQGRTLLVIAHRLSTVQEMDDIIVLDQGRIVESGNHGELLAHQGFYWSLHQSGILLDEAV
jgi:ATP-binding cassette subfamily B protein